LQTSGPPQSSGEPYLDVYHDVDDAYADVFQDNLFYMTPTNIITYVYGSGVRSVTMKVETTEKQDTLRVEIIDPPILTKYNTVGHGAGVPTASNKDAFKKVIKP